MKWEEFLRNFQASLARSIFDQWETKTVDSWKRSTFIYFVSIVFWEIPAKKKWEIKEKTITQRVKTALTKSILTGNLFFFFSLQIYWFYFWNYLTFLWKGIIFLSRKKKELKPVWRTFPTWDTSTCLKNSSFNHNIFIGKWFFVWRAWSTDYKNFCNSTSPHWVSPVQHLCFSQIWILPKTVSFSAFGTWYFNCYRFSFNFFEVRLTF